ncbi:MAG: response regulator transcription factor [Sphingobacteriales bacterium]|nr:MAG: response regulator transcription factor [Sphingobacteriales bacterium]
MQQQKFLIVEDEPKIAATLARGLNECGYDATLAYDGKSGWELFQEEQYSLVILDVNLPKVNGNELCRMIRGDNPQVPIIMLSALSQLDDRLSGYHAGADDYVAKPFEFRELQMKIKALLRRAEEVQSQQDELLTANDLVMNLASKEVFRDNKLIRLTAKEFQLLEYLLRNRNRVVSRADIALHVWEIDFDTNTNVIDVYINYLRNKVDKPFEDKLIHTQVGMGYMLKATG